MTTRIIGTGSYLPETIVTNDDLSKIMDTSDEWIRTRTGIRERHLVKEETTVSMSAEAARRALQDAGVAPEELDLVIVATVSGDYITPAAACMVQAQIGAVHATAFDINGACSGFIFALHTVHAYIQAGMCRTALIIGAETLSKIMDWTDRSTCVLFGDGAGAAIMKREPTDNNMYFYSNAEGDNQGKLRIQGLSLKQPLQNEERKVGHIEMAGNDVFRFAVRAMSDALTEALNKAGKTIDDIDLVIPHQANYRIIKHVIKKLKIDEDKVYINLNKYGNTSAASVAIALAEAKEKGLIKEGAKIVLIGFGAGFTYASGYIEI